MKTLIVDNYDSFTHNLVHLVAEVNQEVPIVIRNDEIAWTELADMSFDNVVISPGPGHPSRSADFGICARLVTECRKPLLGVCLGHQGIAAAYGGKVVRAPYPVHGSAEPIRHLGTDIFQSIESPFFGARYHSLIVQRPIPGDLVETAWTEDGLVMAFAHRWRPLWGVQFHPESIITEHGRQLITNFRNLTIGMQGARGSRTAKAKTTLGTEGKVAVWKEIASAVNTEAAFVRLFGKSPTAFWLDSSLVEAGRARWSYFGDTTGAEAFACSYDAETRMVTVFGREGARRLRGSIFDFLARGGARDIDNPPPCPFSGGYVGWLGYELGRECGGHTPRQSCTPDAYFVHADRFVAVDHEQDRTYVVAVVRPGGRAEAERWVDEMAQMVRNTKPMRNWPSRRERQDGSPPIRFRLDRDRETYLADIEQCLRWIREGETYQVCLTNEISTRATVDPLELYGTLRRVNPAPYAAFLRWPGGAVMSASPERFLQVDANGAVETKPIKGTTARSLDPVADVRLAEQLAASDKDRAENVMIVDLLRNDLSRVCAPGSVMVSKLCDIETYATVHQLVSTVHGRLADGRTAIDLVRAAFPGGSMTGAPKVRTLQFIDQLEHRARGVYSGVLGWFGNDGACDLSIVIRTLVQVGERLSTGVGGGIVAKSNAESEFEEMLLKANASIRAVVTAVAGEFRDDVYVIDGTASSERTASENGPEGMRRHVAV